MPCSRARRHGRRGSHHARTCRGHRLSLARQGGSFVKGRRGFLRPARPLPGAGRLGASGPTVAPGWITDRPSPRGGPPLRCLVGRAAGLAGPGQRRLRARHAAGGHGPHRHPVGAGHARPALAGPPAPVRHRRGPGGHRHPGERALRLDALPVQRDAGRAGPLRGAGRRRGRRVHAPGPAPVGPRGVRRPARAGLRACRRCLRRPGAGAHARPGDPRVRSRRGDLSGRQPGRGAGRHADRATRPGAASGGHPHERQRRPGSRRGDAPRHDAQALRAHRRCPDLGRRGRAALRRPRRGRQQR